MVALRHSQYAQGPKSRNQLAPRKWCRSEENSDVVHIYHSLVHGKLFVPLDTFIDICLISV